MRAGDDDEFRAWGDGRFHAIRIEHVAVVERAIERVNGAAKVCAAAVNASLPGPFNQYLVAGLEQRGENEEVCPGRAGGRGDLRRFDAVAFGDGLEQWLVALIVPSRQLERVVSSGEIVQRAGEDVAQRKVVPRIGARLRPLNVGCFEVHHSGLGVGRSVRDTTVRSASRLLHACSSTIV